MGFGTLRISWFYGHVSPGIPSTVGLDSHNTRIAVNWVTQPQSCTTITSNREWPASSRAPGMELRPLRVRPPPCAQWVDRVRFPAGAETRGILPYTTGTLFNWTGNPRSHTPIRRTLVAYLRTILAALWVNLETNIDDKREPTSKHKLRSKPHRPKAASRFITKV